MWLRLLAGVERFAAGATWQPNGTPQDAHKQRHAFKDSFKYFTALMREMVAVQAMWIVPNVELRDGIHEAVEGIVVERYDTFCRLALSLTFSKHPDTHMIFTAVKVKDMIGSTLKGRA